jgi:hypothetical protein
MALDAATIQRIRAWLASEATSGCPVCKGKEFVVDDVVGVTLVSNQAARRGKSKPTDVERYVSVTCVSLGASKPATDGRFKTSRCVGVQ